MQSQVSDMNGVADQGAGPITALWQVFLVSSDQITTPLNEIVQFVSIQGIRKAGVYLQLHYPRSGQNFGGPNRLLVGDIDLEPAGLGGAEGEHG